MRTKLFVSAAIVVVALAMNAASLRADLVGYWNFDNNVNDSSNGNNGTINGSVTYVAGQFGNATSYDGTVGDYVSVPSSTSLNGSWSGFTLSLWVNAASINGSAFVKAGSGNIALDDVYAYTWSVAGGSYLVSHGSYGGSVWKNLVLRWDGSNLTSYLNGAQQGTTAMTSFSNATAGALGFGEDFRYTRSPFTGSIDDAAFFSNSLTVGETESIYNVGSSALKYSMADMNKLFTLYEAGTGKTTTADGKTWQYVASGLSGTAGTLQGSAGTYSVILSDIGSAGVEQIIPEPGTLVLLSTALIGLLCYAWRRRK